jgi:deazaflavin-dependent oxidoreductase (nitroreductase family)
MPQSDFNLQLIEEFRANGGQMVSGRFKGDALLLLTTMGRKSGESRTTPMGYQLDGDRLYIVAFNARKPTLPHWYFNLGAHPEVTLEVGTETYRARAVVLDDTEGERLLTQFAAREPRIQAALESMAAEAAPRPRRQIPIVRLERLSGA